MAKGQKREVLYRVVKFELHLSSLEIELLQKVSDNLMLVWDDALRERQALFEKHIAPFYEQLKNAGTDTARTGELRKELSRAYTEHRITLFDQINALTPRRTADSVFASVPRNWQEETLDALNGAHRSFLSLRKKGDRNARPPCLRDAFDFHEISGRFGFKIHEGFCELSCGKIGLGRVLRFPIPEHQRCKLGSALSVKKFTLYRDERDIRKPGKFWISLAYEILKPKTLPFNPEEAVYVSLGASSLGIISPKGEEVVALWRPDKHWKPKIDALEERMKRCVKGSRAWRKRNAARLTISRTMAAQQKQDQREVVARELLDHGVHFVVSDIIIRSKKGMLADSSKPERRGALGLNWSAQNTGSMAYLVQWLTEKAQEHGGSVRKHQPKSPPPVGKGHENKIAMARRLRASFLASQTM